MKEALKNKKMDSSKYLIIIIIFMGCFSKPKENKKEINRISITEKDSLEIQNLIREVYKWNENTDYYYFNIGVEHSTKPKYIGVNWSTYEHVKKELIRTGYFTNEFVINYKNILTHIDKKVKRGVYEWNQGELPPFGTGANEWCHCQDTPTDNYWETMIINTIELKNDSVNLTWDWGGNIKWNWINEYKTGYPLTVIKESGNWKISYMDGFDKKHY